MRRRREIEDPNNTWDMQLMAAVLRKDTEEAEKLLEKGAKINHEAADPNGKGNVSPFLACALKADIETMTWICSKGGDPHGKFENGHTILHHCVQNDNADLLENIASNAASINENFSLGALSSEGMTATQLAINTHKPEMAKVLIRNGSNHPFHALVDATHCQTARACRTGDTALLETLLQCGDNPHQRDRNGQTLMHLAVQQPAIMDLLLDRGLSINAQNSMQQSPLQYIVLNMPRNIDLLDALLTRGADPNLGDGLGITPLMQVVSSYSADAIRRLLEAKADVNARDAFGATVVHYAVVARKKGALELLLNIEGSDVNAVDLRGETALHRAVNSGRDDALSVLVAKETVDVNVADTDGNTPLHTGVINNQTDAVKVLLQRANDDFLTAANPKDPKEKKAAPAKKGAKDVPAEPAFVTKLSVDAENKDSLTALQLASRLGRSECVRAIIEAGADVHRRSRHGTLLHEVVYAGNLPLVELLLSKGADVNARNDEDVSPLHMAVREGHVEIAAALVRHGAIIAEQDAYTLKSPLHAACERTAVDLASLLLQNGPTSILHLTDSSVQTPLHVSCLNGDAETTELILENHDKNGFTGSMLDIPDANGDTPVHAACSINSLQCLRLLVQRGASVTAKNQKGWTALHTAVATNSKECMLEVLELVKTEFGKDDKKDAEAKSEAFIAALATPDTAKRTPLLLAAEFGCTDIAKVLVQAKRQAEDEAIGDDNGASAANATAQEQ